MLKLADNPPLRSESLPSVRDAAGPWWVAHTKARNEKALAWDMAAKGIDYFLPMTLRVTFSGDRKRKNMMPLFGSYLFFAGDREARYQVLTTNRVANVIEVDDQERFVAELCGVERALDSGQALEFYPSFAVGQRCRVTKGPLKETLGTVIDAGDVTRIVLQVSTLGVGASLEIDADLLEILDD